MLEAALVAVFDSVERSALQERREMRGAEGALVRLLGQGWPVGVLDGEADAAPERGTPQGAVLSPLLGNVYVHSGLDRWCEPEVKPRLRGQAPLSRYGDDFSMGFAREDEARRGLAVLRKRRGRCGLTLHPDQTRRLPCGRPPQEPHRSTGLAPFDFLGCTCSWARSRQGRWGRGCTTRRARLRRAKQALYDGGRRHRHPPVEAQHAALGRRRRGHGNYGGGSGTLRRLLRLVEATKRAWDKGRCCRRQRTRLKWERCTDLLRQRPLPHPRITVRIWGV
jgi:RNA-directed DNA polymerase